MLFRATIWSQANGQSTHDVEAKSSEDALDQLKAQGKAWDEVKSCNEVKFRPLQAAPATPGEAPAAPRKTGKLFVVKTVEKVEKDRPKDEPAKDRVLWLKSRETCHVFSPVLDEALPLEEEDARAWVAARLAALATTDYHRPEYLVEPAPKGLKTRDESPQPVLVASQAAPRGTGKKRKATLADLKSKQG